MYTLAHKHTLAHPFGDSFPIFFPYTSSLFQPTGRGTGGFCLYIVIHILNAFTVPVIGGFYQSFIRKNQFLFITCLQY